MHVSTPAYSGTHIDGFNDAVRAVVEQLAEAGRAPSAYLDSFVNVFPGLVSSEDLRFLKEVCADFALPARSFRITRRPSTAPRWRSTRRFPRVAPAWPPCAPRPRPSASIELGRTLRQKRTAASFLQERFSVPAKRIGLPIGINESDIFFAAMEKLSGHKTPEKYTRERGRLVDAYVDGHKYLFGKRALVIGDEDMVVGLTAFLAETGVLPVLCATGGKSGAFARSIAEVTTHLRDAAIVREGVDFMTIAEEVALKELKAGFHHRQQQGRQTGAHARSAAHPRRLPHPRPHRRATHSAPRLSRGAAVVRSRRQHPAGSEAGLQLNRLQLHVGVELWHWT